MWSCKRTGRFLSTPSARRATACDRAIIRMIDISIHALREEGDQCGQLRHQLLQDFYPRPPRGGRLLKMPHQQVGEVFLSTPSARRATLASAAYARRVDISIHALREEGDHAAHIPEGSPLDFYPRPPRGGRRLMWLDEADAEKTHFYPRPPRGGRPTDTADTDEAVEFLSTPSARRATRGVSMHSLLLRDFYPRPPRGGRHDYDAIFGGLGYFYPRPPRGGRRTAFSTNSSSRLFLSTPSARRATIRSKMAAGEFGISIHALREEGDSWAAPLPPRSSNFYPRPPRGGRQPY